jgi:hypothetical protein
VSWIVVPNWDRFQHYKDRDPRWIKDHVSQLYDDDWSALTLTERGALQTLRLAFAASDGKLPTSALARIGAHPGVAMRSITTSLSDAGLIVVSASKPLALTRSREKRREEKKKGSASADMKNRPANGELETTGTAVDAEMLKLAHGWIADHGGLDTDRPAH